MRNIKHINYNWRKFFGQESFDRQEKDRLNEIKKELQNLFNNDDENLFLDKDFIWEGMERIGELLATQMILKKSNALF